jgi:hypothetical protein
VNDGSTDGTADIAREFDVRLIETENQGLSRARNTGLAAARVRSWPTWTGSTPDSEWLRFLAARFATSAYGAVGGPNLPGPTPAGRGGRATAPGGTHPRLISDDEAEHIPGCNMAFRREVLEAHRRLRPAVPGRGRRRGLCWRCARRASASASAPPPSCGTTAETRFAPIWPSSADTARPRACSSASGRRNYSPAGHPIWTGRLLRERLGPVPRAAPLARVLRHLGHQPLPVDLPAG